MSVFIQQLYYIIDNLPPPPPPPPSLLPPLLLPCRLEVLDPDSAFKMYQFAAQCTCPSLETGTSALSCKLQVTIM